MGLEVILGFVTIPENKGDSLVITEDKMISMGRKQCSING